VILAPGRPWFSPLVGVIGRSILLGIGLVIGGYAALGQAPFTDRPLAVYVADLLGGWAFLVAGTIAWQRRPANRIGPLLMLIGFSWFVGSYGRLGNETTAHLARSFQGFYEPLLAWVVLAYPSGRIESRAGKVVVAAWLLDQVGWSIARLILARPLSWYGCATCRETVDAYIANGVLLDRLGPLSLAATVVFAVAVIGLLLRRLLAAGPAGRRRLLPAALAGFALGANVAATGAIRIGFDRGLFDDAGVVTATYVLDMLVAVAVLVGLLQDRLAREAVADLVVQLEGVPRGGDPRRKRDALARALRDPTLELLVPDGAGGYRNSAGLAVAMPVAGPGRAVTALGGGRGEAGELGLLVHDPGLLDDPGLVSAVTASLRFEAENERLAGEVERQLAEVQASRARIVAAGDVERRRVERDLHDGAQQRLIALSMELGRLRAAAERSGDSALVGELSDLGRDLESTIGELRELARGIVPGILGDAGLPAAIESLALRSAIPVSTDVRVTERFPTAVESTAYFVIAEALTNVARHAGATSARITLERQSHGLRVGVADDGVGGADLRGGTGLQGLADRVGALGGTLHVESAPGGGTRVTADIPVAG
jgi:signal transduction histidine kinase